MESQKERDKGESWPDFFSLWSISFNFNSIFDKIKKWKEKRKLRQILKNRNEITRARNERNRIF